MMKLPYPGTRGRDTVTGACPLTLPFEGRASPSDVASLLRKTLLPKVGITIPRGSA